MALQVDTLRANPPIVRMSSASYRTGVRTGTNSHSVASHNHIVPRKVHFHKYPVPAHLNEPRGRSVVKPPSRLGHGGARYRQRPQAVATEESQSAHPHRLSQYPLLRSTRKYIMSSSPSYHLRSHSLANLQSWGSFRMQDRLQPPSPSHPTNRMKKRPRHTLFDSSPLSSNLALPRHRETKVPAFPQTVSAMASRIFLGIESLTRF